MDRAATAAESRQLVEIFLDACVRGQLRLSRQQASQIRYDEVPYSIRWNFRRDDPGRFYRIREPLDATLAILSYDPPTKDGWAERCLLFSNHIKRPVAWNIIAASVPGGVEEKSRDDLLHYVLDVPQLRYRITAGSGDYRYGIVVKLQTILYDEATAARLFDRQYRRLKSLRKHGMVKSK
ncbi:MAG TPA: hypothetical protein VF759_16895 [Allosphingosinicella sp.]